MPRQWSLVAFVVLATCVLAVCTGCFTVVMQGINEVRGAQAEIKLNEPVPYDVLRPYRDLRIAPATSPLSARLMPSAVRVAWDREAARLKTDLAELFPGGTPTLEIQTELHYFQEKGLLSPAECLARVRMRGDDKVVVDALVKAESKSFRAGDEGALAEAATKQLEKFIREQKGTTGETGDRRDRSREQRRRDKS